MCEVEDTNGPGRITLIELHQVGHVVVTWLGEILRRKFVLFGVRVLSQLLIVDLEATEREKIVHEVLLLPVGWFCIMASLQFLMHHVHDLFAMLLSTHSQLFW